MAVGEIIAKKNDIEYQLARIDADIRAMQTIQSQIQDVNMAIAHLTYAQQYNQHMIAEINSVISALQLIEGAWKTIANELRDVVENVKLATASELKNNLCLTTVQLTTAANEWLDVANDAQSFTSYFYLQEQAI